MAGGRQEHIMSMVINYMAAKQGKKMQQSYLADLSSTMQLTTLEYNAERQYHWYNNGSC
jgi:hypothetical protein